MSPFNNELAKYFLVPEQYYMLFSILVLVLLFVILLLKGLALWRSARRAQRVWFWVFIFVNTLGILEIFYLLTNKDEFKAIEKKSHGVARDGEKKKKFKLSLKRKPKAKKEEQIALVEPEIAALNEMEDNK